MDSDVLGFIAATLTTVAFLPQALKIIRTRDTRAISLSMYVTLHDWNCPVARLRRCAQFLADDPVQRRRASARRDDPHLQAAIRIGALHRVAPRPVFWNLLAPQFLSTRATIAGTQHAHRSGYGLFDFFYEYCSRADHTDEVGRDEG